MWESSYNVVPCNLTLETGGLPCFITPLATGVPEKPLVVPFVPWPFLEVVVIEEGPASGWRSDETKESES